VKSMVPQVQLSGSQDLIKIGEIIWHTHRS